MANNAQKVSKKTYLDKRGNPENMSVVQLISAISGGNPRAQKIIKDVCVQVKSSLLVGLINQGITGSKLEALEKSCGGNYVTLCKVCEMLAKGKSAGEIKKEHKVDVSDIVAQEK